MSEPKLSINCFLLGSDSSEVFTVKIPKTDNVSVLKDRIKEKQSPRLNHVVASELTVWKVSLPADTISPELTVDDVKALHSVEKISLIFDEDLEDEHVHILVQAPTDRLPSATRLQLNCYVKGEPFKQAFEVKIGNDESVAALKGAIKAERAQTFSNVDAASIVLWNISIPYNPTLTDNVDKLHLDDDGLPQVSDQYIQSLSPLRKLSDIFSKPPIEEHVHIIIKPPPARSTINEANLREKDDIVTALKTNYNEAVKKALNAKSPSESAKSKEYKTYQHKSPIYDGRYDATKPIDTTAPPIQLFHPVFGHFLDDLTNDLCVPPEIAKATIGYMRASSAMYDNEAIRKAALEPHLGRILGNGMGTVMNPDGTRPDGAFSITLTNEICEFAVTLIKEEKNNIGDGGSDPSTQVGLSMARFWAQDQHSGVRNNTCCPTFLLATAGPWFTILGGIFTDKWIVQRLTDFIWVGLDATLKEPHYKRVAHILYSLRRNVEKLRDYYIGLKVSVSDTEDLHPRFFPSICTYRDAEDRIIDFKYIKPLEFDSTCVTFLARTTSSTPKDVVVKFVHRYGEEAHRLLAGKSLAPQLFYHGKIGVLEGDPSYGHLRMVVMEYIDGETLDQVKQILPTFMDQILRALDVLHDHNYVFGDLRGPNILITKNEEVKLIDFDWAGVHMQSQYPLLISPNLKWPTGVEGLTIMKTEHDDIMLAQLHELYLGKV